MVLRNACIGCALFCRIDRFDSVKGKWEGHASNNDTSTPRAKYTAKELADAATNACNAAAPVDVEEGINEEAFPASAFATVAAEGFHVFDGTTGSSTIHAPWICVTI